MSAATEAACSSSPLPYMRMSARCARPRSEGVGSAQHRASAAAKQSPLEKLAVAVYPSTPTAAATCAASMLRASAPSTRRSELHIRCNASRAGMRKPVRQHGQQPFGRNVQPRRQAQTMKSTPATPPPIVITKQSVRSRPPARRR